MTGGELPVRADEIDNLVRMANRIGDFFRYQPGGREVAIEGVAHHLEKFWEPRMRRQILGFLAASPDGVTSAGSVLDDLVRQAIVDNRERLGG
ncbi:MAG: formate dehydrogenase subunit delta [Lautropia sp.]|nr:formate dehydrogenase subunit delta [Lautropia sp.]